MKDHIIGRSPLTIRYHISSQLLEQKAKYCNDPKMLRQRCETDKVGTQCLTKGLSLLKKELLPVRYWRYQLGRLKTNTKIVFQIAKKWISFTGIEPRWSQQKHHISRTTGSIEFVVGSTERGDKGEWCMQQQKAKLHPFEFRLNCLAASLVLNFFEPNQKSWHFKSEAISQRHQPQSHIEL